MGSEMGSVQGLTRQNALRSLWLEGTQPKELVTKPRTEE